ncbi:Acetyl-CoA carboxylase, biotin carboxylase [Liquorilactobacillus oeni DSM 19972]|uniref:biotin carboxylase n=1 Tax=Liquorilactobacillus oeni DSM 19972 TaxID=1423777 RepID=A0A0R1MMF0_9LACO|nr:Acetyl-CoA carboxylase, biotin carboxylase [Liquorilactobacillus oeni DSM 19972]
MNNLKKVLIANRGEIAVRIIQACHLLKLKCVAVYSTADKEALHVQLADESVCIGGPDSNQSYLNQQNLLAAAEITNADAIHPGYGFLSENADFAHLCEQQNIKFIGPSSKVIALMGEKANARETMETAGVPIVPGSPRDFIDVDSGLAIAKKIGYPVMLKASAGGGGKGMRVIHSEMEFKQKFSIAQKEAQSAFNDTHMYEEKYLEHPRHVEVQLVADQQGHVVILGNRDCTLQQNHQKVIEEAPAVIVDKATQDEMFRVCIRAAKQIQYEGAGTIEFLYDAPGKFYFMEMNTRIQVEHPVTELTTQTDIVALQLRIARGEPLTNFKEVVSARGFALECRVTAKTAGQIKHLLLPSGHGIRTDRALYQGYKVPPNYDAMIAKIIAYGPDRQTTIRQMQIAIEQTVVEGIRTNLDFLMQLLQEPDFIKNTTDVNWIDLLTHAK